MSKAWSSFKGERSTNLKLLTQNRAAVDQEVIGHVTPLKNMGFILSKVKFQFCSFRKLFAGHKKLSESQGFFVASSLKSLSVVLTAIPAQKAGLALAPLMHVVLELGVLAGEERVASFLSLQHKVIATVPKLCPANHK